jgi:peptidoglycan/xylan/chitin deacetylase (PgdA/CDA1 family)
MMPICFTIFFLSFGFVQPPVSLYLTSDDGPGPGSKWLYYLADSGKVKMNLFIVGSRALHEDSVWNVLKDHRQDTFLLFANHSYSHAGGHYRSYYEDPGTVLKDFDRTRDVLGLDNRIARLPGRNYWRVGDRRADDIFNGKESADSLAAKGYEVFGWDIEWKLDTSKRVTASEMLEKIDRAIRNKWTFMPGHMVILFHDEAFDDAVFRREFLAFIKLVGNRGHYRLRHLTDYPLKGENDGHTGK